MKYIDLHKFVYNNINNANNVFSNKEYTILYTSFGIDFKRIGGFLFIIFIVFLMFYLMSFKNTQIKSKTKKNYKSMKKNQ